MDSLIEKVLGEYAWVLDLIAYLVLAASLIVKWTPTLKDDNWLLPVVKFVGRWVALNKYKPTARPL